MWVDEGLKIVENMINHQHEPITKKQNYGNPIKFTNYASEKLKQWNKDYKNKKNFQTINIPPTKFYRLDYDQNTYDTIPKQIKINYNKALNDTIKTFKLNCEQIRPLKKFTSLHLNSNTSSQKLIYCGGPGGCGKTQVLFAIQYFYNITLQSERLLTGGTTGVAACHVSGQTINSLLNIPIYTNQRVNEVSRDLESSQDLQKRWLSVTEFAVEETSMISAVLNFKMSKQLMLAKENSLPYGNVNMIWTGDQRQLPPIQQIALFKISLAEKQALLNNEERDNQDITDYTHFLNDIDMDYQNDKNKIIESSDTESDEEQLLKAKKNENHSKKQYNSQKAIEAHAGRMLWLNFTDAYLLTTQIRQRNDINYAKLLNRLRDNILTENDIKTIQSRIIKHLTLTKLFEIPIIVTINKIREKFNILSLDSYCSTKQLTKYVNMATDINQKNPTKPFQKNTLTFDALQNLLHTPCRKLIKSLILVKTAKYHITTNICVSMGLVNGAEVTLESIVLDKNTIINKINTMEYHLEQHPHHIVVKLDMNCNIKNQYFDDFDENCFPIFSEYDYALLKLPNNKNVQIKRLQIPLTLGYAFTVWKSQCKTYKSIIADLDRAPGFNGKRKFPDNGVYVIMTRPENLLGLNILRPFDPTVLKQPTDKDLLEDEKRLIKLAKNTK
jgi:hypothetical protein